MIDFHRIAHNFVCGLQVRVIRRFWIVQKWDLDGYRVARVTFFSDDDPADPSVAAAAAAATESAAVDTPVSRKETVTGHQLSDNAQGNSALTRTVASMCTSLEQPGSDSPTTAGPRSSSRTVQACAPSMLHDRDSSASIPTPGSHHAHDESQHTGAVRPIAHETSAESTVVYSAQLPQMARHVQITVKEWLVSRRIAVRALRFRPHSSVHTITECHDHCLYCSRSGAGEILKQAFGENVTFVPPVGRSGGSSAS